MSITILKSKERKLTDMNTDEYTVMCYGCYVDGGRCGIQSYNLMLAPSCPCRKCLIKSVCLKSCEPYDKLATTIFHKDDLEITMKGKKV